MKSRLLNDGPERSWMLVFETGDPVKSALVEFARRHDVRAGRFHAIGAFRDVVLQYFDWGTKEYLDIPVNEQVEVLTMTGTVARNEGEPAIHAHLIVGRRDGGTRGGHLKEAHVRPTLELVLTASATELERKPDDESGLALIRP